MNIGSAKSQFTSSLFKEQFGGIFFLNLANDIGGTVGRTVVDNKYMKIFLQGKYCFQNAGYILFLIISWYNNYLFQLS
jgi:hypothetical protein